MKWTHTRYVDAMQKLRESPSIAEAARKLGIADSTLLRAFRRVNLNALDYIVSTIPVVSPAAEPETDEPFDFDADVEVRVSPMGVVQSGRRAGMSFAESVTRLREIRIRTLRRMQESVEMLQFLVEDALETERADDLATPIEDVYKG